MPHPVLSSMSGFRTDALIAAYDVNLCEFLFSYKNRRVVDVDHSHVNNNHYIVNVIRILRIITAALYILFASVQQYTKSYTLVGQARRISCVFFGFWDEKKRKIIAKWKQ